MQIRHGKRIVLEEVIILGTIQTGSFMTCRASPINICIIGNLMPNSTARHLTKNAIIFPIIHQVEENYQMNDNSHFPTSKLIFEAMKREEVLDRWWV